MASAKELLARRNLPVIGIVLALVLMSWLFWYFSDRQVIRRQLIGLTWEVSRKNSQESTMEAALKMGMIKDALAANCRIMVPETHFDENMARDMAVMYLMHYRDQYERIAAEFEEMRIEFPAKSEAAVQGAVSLQTQRHQQAEKEVAAQVKLALQKQDGVWRLIKAEIPAALVE
jgi:hypothetical protein